VNITKQVETIAAVGMVALVILGCLVVLRPFMSAILWAGVLCYCTWPLYTRLHRAFPRRRNAIPLIMTLALSVVLVVPFVVVGMTLANNVARLAEWSLHAGGGLPETAPPWLQHLPVVGATAEQYWEDIVRDTERTSALLKAAALAGGKWILHHGIDFGMGIAQLVLSVLVAFVFYRDGEAIVARIVAVGRRVAGDAVQRNLHVVGRTVRSVVFGVIATNMAQGIMAGLGFRLAGVPSVFLLGLLTFVVSFIPMGAPLIWVSAAVWLFLESHGGAALFLFLWGLIAISGIENVVRPYLIKYGTNLPFVTILLGVLGGLMAFGFIGLFLGPVLLAVGYSLLREFTTREPPAG
jgi:predicted PurR-regulated permease PerM